ncbi:MAG: class I SAM-dependent methyltransferase [Patescibacteria group bacterium]|jgi:hypothetical protein
MYKTIKACRICGNKNLKTIINLGDLTLTGVFPKNVHEEIESGPLQLVRCVGDKKTACGLVQLKHSFEQSKMYGDNYGYRSGLNRTMVDHLKDIFVLATKAVTLKNKDLIIDIGSNDGTLLNNYDQKKYTLAGIDPTSKKFRDYYHKGINVFPEFFSAELVAKKFPGMKAKIITSIAMFYDLENPLAFVEDIYRVLDDNGVWIFEQSYFKSMVKVNAYDTICHEHLEYYTVRQIKWLLDQADMKIIHVELNDTNGGSFLVTAAKKKSGLKENTTLISRMLKEETAYGLSSDKLYVQMKEKILAHKKELKQLLKKLRMEGKTVVGCGASTKGNVILQYCGLTAKDIPIIADVNEYKHGRVTPGSKIPIASEEEVRKLHPDYMLVLPWHFKANLIKREASYTQSGGKLIFPLPKIEIL